jgi:type II secretory pathway component PulF
LRALKVTYDIKKSQITGKTAGYLALSTPVILVVVVVVVVVAFMLSAIPAAEAAHYRGMRHFPSANLSMTKGNI